MGSLQSAQGLARHCAKEGICPLTTRLTPSFSQTARVRLPRNPAAGAVQTRVTHTAHAYQSDSLSTLSKHDRLRVIDFIFANIITVTAAGGGRRRGHPDTASPPGGPVGGLVRETVQARAQAICILLHCQTCCRCCYSIMAQPCIP